jgi:hypothetical protein
MGRPPCTSPRHGARAARWDARASKGQTLASPHEMVAHRAHRTRLTVAWEGGTTSAIEVVTGTGHWYRIGEALVEVRWV